MKAEKSEEASFGQFILKPESGSSLTMLMFSHEARLEKETLKRIQLEILQIKQKLESLKLINSAKQNKSELIIIPSKLSNPKGFPHSSTEQRSISNIKMTISYNLSKAKPIRLFNMSEELVKKLTLYDNSNSINAIGDAKFQSRLVSEECNDAVEQTNTVLQETPNYNLRHSKLSFKLLDEKPTKILPSMQILPKLNSNFVLENLNQANCTKDEIQFSTIDISQKSIKKVKFESGLLNRGPCKLKYSNRSIGSCRSNICQDEDDDDDVCNNTNFITYDPENNKAISSISTFKMVKGIEDQIQKNIETDLIMKQSNIFYEEKLEGKLLKLVSILKRLKEKSQYLCVGLERTSSRIHEMRLEKDAILTLLGQQIKEYMNVTADTPHSHSRATTKTKSVKHKEKNIFVFNEEVLFKSKQKADIKRMEDQELYLNREIKCAEFIKVSYQGDIKKLEMKKEIYKEEINMIKKKLFVHYHELLLEGKDTRKKGLTWIMLAIWKLGFEVYMSYMPKFLDNKLITYFFLRAHKEIELIKIGNLLQELKEQVRTFRGKEYRKQITINHKKFSKFEVRNINSYLA